MCKVETQCSQVELLRQKNKMLLEEKRQLQLRVENLERSVTTSAFLHLALALCSDQSHIVGRPP